VRAAESLAASLVGSAQVGCWLIGHNSLGFDLPLVVAQHTREQRLRARSTCGLHRIAPLFEGLLDFAGILDTLRLSRSMARSGIFKPPAFNLQALHSHVLRRPMPAAHTALGDARGLAEICMQEPMCHTLVAAISGSNCIQERSRDTSLMGIVATLRQAIVACSHSVRARSCRTTVKLRRRVSSQGVGRKRGRNEHVNASNCWHPTQHAVKFDKQDHTANSFIREPPCITLAKLSNSKASLHVGVLAATTPIAETAAAAATSELDPFPSSMKICSEGTSSQYLRQERHIGRYLLPVAAKHRRWKRQILRETRR